ncbi:MAG TPA: SDR family oxidoreductase [Actinomycetes bacterium]|nr:SDR family oxidoreductase [Actinomycetes bacterium]
MSDGNRRLAVVTGGAGAIGGAICTTLLASGHEVVSFDMRPPEDPTVGAVVLDLGQEAEVRTAAAGVLARHGRCDVVVHAAAAFDRATLGSLDLATFHRVQRVNVDSYLLLAQAFVPAMTARGFGRLVAVVSDTVWSPPSADLLAYVTSKAALVGLTRALATALGRHGVTASAVAPGLTDTPAAREAMDDTVFDSVVSHQALPRRLVAADVAAAVAFLAGDSAESLTGQVLCVDGGLVLR